MKKRNLIIGVVSLLMILLSFGGCGTTTEKTPSDGAATSESESDKGELGNYAFVIDKAKIVKDWDGKKALLVSFDFTNNGEDAASFMGATSVKAFQDGVELETTFLSSDSKDYNDNDSKDIKPGTTIKVKQAYLLPNTKSPVEVELTEFFSLSDDKLTKTFNIDK